MPMKWLEPAIEKRIEEICDRLGKEDPEEFYKRFMGCISKVDGQATLKDVLFELENTFVLRTRQAAEISYRAGLTDGLNLK